MSVSRVENLNTEKSRGLENLRNDCYNEVTVVWI